jgi:hypothetical protein
MAEQNRNFLEYLDKEMTIMGILSSFAIAGVGLFIKDIVSAEPQKQVLLCSLWSHSWLYILCGSGSILVSAGLFYRQRAELAWYYGQIALAMDSANEGREGELRKEADSWAAWISYFSAFKFLWIGILAYTWAFLRLKEKIGGAWLIALGACVAVYGLAECFLLLRFRYEDNPLTAFVELRFPNAAKFLNRAAKFLGQ